MLAGFTDILSCQVATKTEPLTLILVKKSPGR